MPKFTHSFFRYIPANDERRSFFKYVTVIETEDDNVPQFDDHYCIDLVKNLETDQIRIKNHSAPEYCVSKYVGWSLDLPPVEKQNKEPIFVVFHRSSYAHKKIEFDEFLEPVNKRFTQDDWKYLIMKIKKRFDQQKTWWAENEEHTNCMYEDGTSVFQGKMEFKAFSMGRRAYFLYHLVYNNKFRHLIRDLNISYTD